MTRLALLTSLVAVAASGCTVDNPGRPGPDACTLIGCQDQVTVSFARAGALEYQATVTADGKVGTFRCTTMGVQSAVGVSISRCDQSGFVVLGKPAALEVSVTCGLGPDDAGVLRCSGTFAPTYQTLQPNGPGCDPTCRQASVQLP